MPEASASISVWRPAPLQVEIALQRGFSVGVEDAIRAISDSNDLLRGKDFVTQPLYLDADVWEYLDASLEKDDDLTLLYKSKTI